MTTFFLGAALFIVLMTVLPVVRIILGPSIYDRVLGVSLIGTNAILLLLLIGFVYQRSDMFVDLAIAYAVLNFMSVVAVSKYLEHKRDRQ